MSQSKGGWLSLSLSARVVKYLEENRSLLNQIHNILALVSIMLGK